MFRTVASGEHDQTDAAADVQADSIDVDSGCNLAGRIAEKYVQSPAWSTLLHGTFWEHGERVVLGLHRIGVNHGNPFGYRCPVQPSIATEELVDQIVGKLEPGPPLR